MNRIIKFFWEIFKIVVIALIIVIPIRYYIFQPFFVRGASMEPNFENGEYLIINEIGYKLGDPQRGDVIVFRYPQDPSQYYIKRIIGLPKERVEIKNNSITVFNNKFSKGKALDESFYLPSNEFTKGEVRINLEENEYFVLGDNRAFSSDSRRWGTLSGDYLIGKVWLRAWPLDKLGVIRTPQY